ncbi:MAG: Flavin-dependent thymidylate synthase [Chlamydiae bacterium]|nr:Flavin-dependent thymidylate synthase [Chlamydiota bacterium]
MNSHEEFSENQIKILEHFVTDTTSNVFVLRNLPEVIKGALFSRYSRSSLGLRSLLLKEFILNEETAFASIAGDSTGDGEGDDQISAIHKAQNFYDRILDGYGDDSIGELGGAHLAIENISMLAAKVIEDSRLGGSPLEKSTRYIYFDQKVNGEYLFYKEPVLMTSAYRNLYVETCNMLFETYSALIPPMTTFMEAQFPKEEHTSKVAYGAAVRAKVLDCLRGLLPSCALTNMGVFGNGRFFETLIKKLNVNNLAELQDLGRDCYQELFKVIPSFIRRADSNHKNQIDFARFYETMQEEVKVVTKEHAICDEGSKKPGVTLIDYNPKDVVNVAAALLYSQSDKRLGDLKEHCAQLSVEDLARIIDASCNSRENRRHKSPRALEHATFTFEIISDFGCYRDLQRHRILTQERQLLTCNYDYFIPAEVLDTEMEDAYRDAMDKARMVYNKIAHELPEEAQYIVPMAYNMPWYFHINLRSLQWLCELRSSPAGHPNYRYVAQEMAKLICVAIPAFEPLFKFVDYEGYELGRLDQEIRKAEKSQN